MECMWPTEDDVLRPFAVGWVVRVGEGGHSATLCEPRGVAQPGSARRSGRRGPRFKSGHPDTYETIRVAMRRARRTGLALLSLVAVSLAVPSAASAHAVSGIDYRFPLPIWLFALAAGVAVLASAPAAMFAVRSNTSWTGGDFYGSIRRLHLGTIGLVVFTLALVDVRRGRALRAEGLLREPGHDRRLGRLLGRARDRDRARGERVGLRQPALGGRPGARARPCLPRSRRRPLSGAARSLAGDGARPPLELDGARLGPGQEATHAHGHHPRLHRAPAGRDGRVRDGGLAGPRRALHRRRADARALRPGRAVRAPPGRRLQGEPLRRGGARQLPVLLARRRSGRARHAPSHLRLGSAARADARHGRGHLRARAARDGRLRRLLADAEVRRSRELVPRPLDLAGRARDPARLAHHGRASSARSRSRSSSSSRRSPGSRRPRSPMPHAATRPR